MIYESTKEKLYAVVIIYFDLKLCSIVNIISFTIIKYICFRYAKHCCQY